MKVFVKHVWAGVSKTKEETNATSEDITCKGKSLMSRGIDHVSVYAHTDDQSLGGSWHWSLPVGSRLTSGRCGLLGEGLTVGSRLGWGLRGERNIGAILGGCRRGTFLSTACFSEETPKSTGGLLLTLAVSQFVVRCCSSPPLLFRPEVGKEGGATLVRRR